MSMNQMNVIYQIRNAQLLADNLDLDFKKVTVGICDCTANLLGKEN